MASRFWVGGAGTWDSTTTTHWSASTGGAGGASAPVTADTVTFDGSSGGGTVTVDSTINGLSLTSITMGAFTGTLDFSVNNPSITLTLFSNSGAGTRTLNMGSGTWTITNASGTLWDFTTVTGLTFNSNTSSLVFNYSIGGINTKTINLGVGMTYNSISITDTNATRGYGTNLNAGSSATVVTTLTLNGPLIIDVLNSFTIGTNLITTGTGLSLYNPSSGPTITLPVAGVSISNILISHITFGTGTATVTNGLNGGGVTGATFISTSSGGGGIIGS